MANDYHECKKRLEEFYQTLSKEELIKRDIEIMIFHQHSKYHLLSHCQNLSDMRKIIIRK